MTLQRGLPDAERQVLRRGLLPGRLALVDDAHAPQALELQLGLEREGLVRRLQAADELAPLALLVAELPLDGDLAADRWRPGLPAHDRARGRAAAALAGDLPALELDPRRERRGERRHLDDRHRRRARVAVLVEGDDLERVRADGELAGALPRGEADRRVVGQRVGEVPDLLAAVVVEGDAGDADSRVAGRGLDVELVDELRARRRLDDPDRRRVEVAARRGAAAARRRDLAERRQRRLGRAVDVQQAV